MFHSSCSYISRHSVSDTPMACAMQQPWSQGFRSIHFTVRKARKYLRSYNSVCYVTWNAAGRLRIGISVADEGKGYTYKRRDDGVRQRGFRKSLQSRGCWHQRTEALRSSSWWKHTIRGIYKERTRETYATRLNSQDCETSVHRARDIFLPFIFPVLESLQTVTGTASKSPSSTSLRHVRLPLRWTAFLHPLLIFAQTSASPSSGRTSFA